MRKVWIGAIVLIVLIILSIFIALYYPKTNRRIIPNALTNITDLYALFAPYMLNFVNTRQISMSCQPTQYYYLNSANNTQFCLICGKFDICYGYIFVNRDGKQMMNPGSVSLAGDYTNKDYVNLQSYGVAYALNCNCGDSYCSCDKGITASMKNINGSMSKINVFTFPSSLNINNEIKNIALKMNKDDCQIIQNESRIICTDLCAFKLSSNEVIFGIC